MRQFPFGHDTEVLSFGSEPEIIYVSNAQSSKLLVSGPIDNDSGIAPKRLSRQYVGFIPTRSQHDAGKRIEPLVSEPSEP